MLLARPLVRGAIVASGLAVGGCARGGSPAPATPTAAAAHLAIDTVGLPRIRFAPGSTSGILDDSLGAGLRHELVVNSTHLDSRRQ